MSDPWPRIPYGMADFRAIRREGYLYVDKTRFLRSLEEERYAVLIRPRRFGKSCWVSMLEHYYDRRRSAEFEALFGGTDIGREPTANRHRYVVLRFDFSAFDDTLDTLRERFEEYCRMVLRSALERNPDLFPEAPRQRILAPSSVNGSLNELFLYAGERDIPLYVLIDEYDNFANTVFAYHGPEAYRAFTHGGGFYRNFFSTLKAGAGQGGAVERMFITGVSPITLDDVTSGFNIASNVSLKPKFNEMLGFTEAEVRALLETYRGRGVLDQEPETALDIMREWYDGYRFANGVETDLYNTDMVLYYLKESIPNEPMPDRLIDDNVRIDYGKLRHLLVTGRRLNGNFGLLRQVLVEEGADAEIRASFPLERLAEREHFLSLLHYFGLLSIRGAAGGASRLGLPNQTVKRLMYGYLRDAFDDVGVFSVDGYEFFRLAQAMAYEGAWEPALAYLRTAIAEQTGIRDYIDGEKVVQAFLAAHFSMTDCFMLHSEYELNKGYADLYLEPFVARHPEMQCGYVLELKYLKRGARRAGGGRVAAALDEALGQVRKYLGDPRLARRYPGVRHVGLGVVFHGWEMAAFEAVDTQAPAP